MLLSEIKDIKNGKCITKDAEVFVHEYNDVKIYNDGGTYYFYAGDGSKVEFSDLDSAEKRIDELKNETTDGALSDLFGGLADSLLEVTEKEARDSASDWFDNLGLDEDTKALIDLFSSKQKIKDHEDLHSLAENLGVESSKLEEKVYSLLQSFFANGKYMAEGDIDIDDKELEMGDSVEREHTSSPIIARRIALDHLTEIPNYYTLLAKMEGK